MAVDYTPSFDPADVDSDYGSTGGDITVPTFTANMKPFRFWCQRALPLVYDDSLSYYEVLCKVVDQMNGFLTDLQTATGSIGEFAQQFVVNQQFLNDMADQLGKNVEDLETYINNRMDDFTAAYQQLQSYVNNYFDNLDVQQEINTKLDAMAADGTFNTLFNPVITAWMTAKTAQIDSAIANQDAIQAQQNGRISVLEGRMNGFSSLPAGSTSGNAELLDIRTNFLGETYPSAGDAVRSSDMIVSGFQSIGFTRLTNWDGNGESSVVDTIVFDVSSYKGGHVVVIANMESFVQNIVNGSGISLYGSNVAGKTVDNSARQYPFPDGFSGTTNAVFKSYAVISTSIQGEERIMMQLSIPNDFAFQYLKLGDVEVIPQNTHTTPEAIVYASSWSKTPVDATLSIAGDAADAKATGDKFSSINGRLDNLVFGKNLIGEKPNYLYRVYIPANSTITVSRADGENMSSLAGVRLTYYNKDRSISNYKGLDVSSTYRTFAVDNFDVYWISANSNVVLQVEYGNLATSYVPYIAQPIDAIDTGTEYKEGITKITKGISFNPSDFEIGNIVINVNGWRYNDSYNRVRTKPGITYKLRKGDKIVIDDYSKAQAYIGWKNDNGVYSYSGWTTQDYSVTEDGEYVFLLKAVPETTQQTIYNLLKRLTIIRNYDFEDWQSAITERDIEPDLKWTRGVISGTNGQVFPDPNNTNRVYSQFIFAKKGSVISVPYPDSVPTAGWTFIIYLYDIHGSFVRNTADWTAIAYKTDADYVIRILARHANNSNISDSDIENLNSILKFRQSPVNHYNSRYRATIVKSINHRGWYEAPENTIPAYIQSFQHNFDYVETDVRFTSDGYCICLHDSTLARTGRNPDGSEIVDPKNVSEMTYSEVESYDVGIYKSPEYAGTKVPTLAEVLTCCKSLGMHLYIDIKYELSKTEIQNIIDIVTDNGMMTSVTFLIGTWQHGDWVTEYAPTANIGVVASSEVLFVCVPRWLTGENAVFVDGQFDRITSTLLQRFKNWDIPLELWSINDTSYLDAANPYYSGITSDNINAQEYLKSKYDN